MYKLAKVMEWQNCPQRLRLCDNNDELMIYVYNSQYLKYLNTRLLVLINALVKHVIGYA